jgi:hypothetical protein
MKILQNSLKAFFLKTILPDAISTSPLERLNPESRLLFR